MRRCVRLFAPWQPSAVLAAVVLAVTWGGCRQNGLRDAGLRYPETYRDPGVVDDYHGTAIADPYRWLEEDTSASTRDWVAAQNAVTSASRSPRPTPGTLGTARLG